MPPAIKSRRYLEIYALHDRNVLAATSICPARKQNKAVIIIPR